MAKKNFRYFETCHFYFISLNILVHKLGWKEFSSTEFVYSILLSFFHFLLKFTYSASTSKCKCILNIVRNGNSYFLW